MDVCFGFFFSKHIIQIFDNEFKNQADLENPAFVLFSGLRRHIGALCIEVEINRKQNLLGKIIRLFNLLR